MKTELPLAASASGSEIDVHFRTFHHLVARAEDLVTRGRYEEAALCSHVAAEYAWHNHPGVFASRRLEDVLLAIGRDALRGVPPTAIRPSSSRGTPRHVLHVLTQAYRIGGHTRLVWRWIQQDAGRSHSVVLTDQGGERIPPLLEEAVHLSGGKLHVLDLESGDVLSQARVLREIAVAHDHVVLHIHPHDVIPIIALADRRSSPPVILLNHADHVFWVGVCVGDVVASLRESGLRLSEARRGVEAQRCILLAIPLIPVERTLPRSTAKKQLGLREDSVTLVSIAGSYKYTPIADVSFVDAVVPVLERHRQTVLVLVGPGPEDLRRGAGFRLRESILALGEREDVAPIYQAADVYVDSFPFSSNTALLEAGSYGVPLVSHCAHSDRAAVLCADSPGFSRSLLRVAGIEELRVALSRLIDDPELRERMGRQTRQEILDLHSGARWKESLERLYARASACAQRGIAQADCDEKCTSELDLSLARLHIHAGMARGLEGSVEGCLAQAFNLRAGGQLASARRRAITILWAVPWAVRLPRVRSSLVSLARHLALVVDPPIPAVRELCADLRDVAREEGLARGWVKRLAAEVWAEVAVALAFSSRGRDREAGYAAARAVLHKPPNAGRRLLLRLVVRGVFRPRVDSLLARLGRKAQRSASPRG